MKTTNSWGLPQFLVSAASDEYPPKENEIRVTTLIGPPLIRRLLIDKWDELTVDAAEKLYMLLGQGVHSLQEKYETSDSTEERICAEVDGLVVTGQSDVYHKGVIEDLKVTTVRVNSFIENKRDWEEQLNCYAWLWRMNEKEVRKLLMRVFYRDWHLKDFAVYKKHEYPPVPYAYSEVNLWSFEEQDAFIRKRVRIHKEAKDKTYKEIECSNEDKWFKPDRYAVKTKKASKARRVLDTYDEAQAWIKQNVKAADQLKATIEHRPGTCDRCKLYCGVRSICPFSENPHII